ncbi:helix-turn-helix domain-containing protein [Bacillus massiliigorillae]|uniref:helix-turn-helix domain-containing protein n=1 Tax=Bacillus massiliigorillae TaxID=1243664 RepID=UPI0003A4727D|nr:helix-turn-helix transcriptional regulator [Bacillus massiliigorillae]
MTNNKSNLRNEYLLKRREKRITQKAIADYIGISNSAISKYERGNIDLIDTYVNKYKKFIDEYQNQIIKT